MNILLILESAELPINVIRRAEEMYSEIKSRPYKVGDSCTLDGFWIETHTLGCRREGGDPEEEWWDKHWNFYTDYKNDSISTVMGDPEEGTFVTITPLIG